jgi:hypothetical protein
MSHLKLFFLFLILLCFSEPGWAASVTAQGSQPPVIDLIPDITLEAGDIRRIMVSASDPDGNSGLRLSLVSSPSYVLLTDNGNGSGTILLAPSCFETQSGQITVQVIDPSGLSAQGSFNVTVQPDQPPKIVLIPDRVVRVCEPIILRVEVDTGGNPSRLSIVSAPAFVSIADNGDDIPTIFIAPSLTDRQGGRITITVTDSCGRTATTSFNITIIPCVLITAATYTKPNLFIAGLGFNAPGASVTVNGQNVSARILGQNDNSITVRGSKKKLNLKKGQNQIVVNSGGVVSNTFVLNLLF